MPVEQLCNQGHQKRVEVKHNSGARGRGPVEAHQLKREAERLPEGELCSHGPQTWRSIAAQGNHAVPSRIATRVARATPPSTCGHEARGERGDCRRNREADGVDDDGESRGDHEGFDDGVLRAPQQRTRVQRHVRKACRHRREQVWADSNSPTAVITDGTSDQPPTSLQQAPGCLLPRCTADVATSTWLPARIWPSACCQSARFPRRTAT